MTNEFTSAPPPQALIMDTVFGFFRARTLQVFAELGVADAIAAGRDPGVNERFLRAAAALGLVRSLDAGFVLTPLGEALRSDVPGSLHGFAASVLGGGHYRGWGALAEAARTGECAFDKVHGEDIWSYFTKTNPAEGLLFNQAMAGSSAMIVQSVLAHYEFPEHGLFVDVAMTMLLNTPAGDAYTQAELEAMLHAAGFTENVLHHVPSGAQQLILSR